MNKDKGNTNEEQPRNQTVDEQIQAMLGTAKPPEETDDAEEDVRPDSEQGAEGSEELDSDGAQDEEESEEETSDEDSDELDEEEEEEEEDEGGEGDDEDEDDDSAGLDDDGADEDEDAEDDDEEDDELSQLRRENEALKRTIDQRSDTSPPREELDPEPEALEVNEVQLVDDATYDAALESKDALNKLLNAVRKDAIEFTYEAVLKRIPQVVQRQVSHESAQQKMVDDFFRANEDLLPVRRYVALEFQQLMAKNPDMSYPDLLAQTAKVVRTSLGMTQRQGRKGKPKKKSRRRGPSMPDGSRNRTQPRKPGGIGAEIAAMASAGR